MNWNEAKAGVLSGSKCAYQTDWQNLNEGVVLHDNQMWLAADTYIEIFVPTPEQEAATNWALAEFDGDLPPR